MTEKKRIELTRLQGIIAVAGFGSGVIIAMVSIVSELLVLCGAILGVKASYDTKFRKFEAEIRQVERNALTNKTDATNQTE